MESGALKVWNGEMMAKSSMIRLSALPVATLAPSDCKHVLAPHLLARTPENGKVSREFINTSNVALDYA